MYKYIVLGRGKSYFVRKQNSDPNTNATTDRPICINCFLPLPDLFYYLYETQFMQGSLGKNDKKIARMFNFTSHYRDNIFH
jgi:hypothetical protein